MRLGGGAPQPSPEEAAGGRVEEEEAGDGAKCQVSIVPLRRLGLVNFHFRGQSAAVTAAVV